MAWRRNRAQPDRPELVLAEIPGPEITGSGIFDRSLQRDEMRLLIRSRCVLCGKCRIVSHYDGSLAEWESHHACKITRG